MLTSTLLLTAAHAVQAQSAPADTPSPAPVATTGTVDVSRLPIDLRRIERQFKQASSREERDGLNLRYFIEVVAPAPPLVFLTKEDNLTFGPVPYGAPTHSDMLWMLTPLEHRGSSMYAMPLYRLPIGGGKKGK